MGFKNTTNTASKLKEMESLTNKLAKYKNPFIQSILTNLDKVKPFEKIPEDEITMVHMLLKITKGITEEKRSASNTTHLQHLDRLINGYVITKTTADKNKFDQEKGAYLKYAKEDAKQDPSLSSSLLDNIEDLCGILLNIVVVSIAIASLFTPAAPFGLEVLMDTPTVAAACDSNKNDPSHREKRSLTKEAILLVKKAEPIEKLDNKEENTNTNATPESTKPLN